MRKGPLAARGPEVSVQEFVRCWNDPEGYPLRRLEARWQLSAQTIRRRATDLREDGYAMIERGRERWDG